MALNAIERIRKIMPNAMFTTDIIVGFPGETEEDFEATVEFVKKAKFLSAHIFTYSKRDGTVAAAMPDQIPEEVKKERSARLIALQSQITDELLQGEIGKEYDVLFETREAFFVTGHTPSFIEVKAVSDTDLQGEIKTVRITDVSKGVCFGVII